VPSIIFGKSVIGTLKGLVGAGIMLGLGKVLEPDIHISVQLVAIIVFCCITFSLLGVMAGLLARSTPTLNMISSVVILPMTFMCGTLFAVDSLPAWASAIIRALPLTHSSETIRACALDLEFPWVSLGILVVYFAAFFAVDCMIIRKKLY
jgi:ABC-type multidrug transport system permease subunit